MKRFLSLLIILALAGACNSGNQEGGYTEDNLPNPEKVEPATDAIPEDMEIKNDSDIVVDSPRLSREMDTLRKESSKSRQ